MGAATSCPGLGTQHGSDTEQKSLDVQLKKHIWLGMGSSFCFCFKTGKAKVSLPCERKEPAGTER